MVAEFFFCVCVCELCEGTFVSGMTENLLGAVKDTLRKCKDDGKDILTFRVVKRRDW